MRSRKEIASMAAALLRDCRIAEPPVPVEHIALQSNIKIARSAAEWSESGFLLRDSGNVIIGINSRNSPKRQRFTIAHELGHWLLHDDKRLIVDEAVRVYRRNNVSSQASDEQEMEANSFAAELLMPEPMVIRVARQLQPNAVSREDFVTTLAKHFDVSIEAMGYRLINLGVLSS